MLAQPAEDSENPSVSPPIRAVWEMTLRCDQVCLHCVNSAGRPGPDELGTNEALEVCRQLIALGVRELAITGGESYLRRDLLQLVRYLTEGGIRVSMQTGGRTLTLEKARALKDAGLILLGVSVDGTESIHDLQRGSRGSFTAALHAIDVILEAGLQLGANTQVNRLTRPVLLETAALLRDHRVGAWQLHLTIAAGRATQHLDWVLQPWEVVPVIETLAAIQRDALEHPRSHELEQPFELIAGSNIGYFGPHETLLRSHRGGPSYWRGCSAGLATIFIEADGTVSGSTFLPRDPYACGNVREHSLEALWRRNEVMAYTRRRSVEDLWGFCRTCYYADVCYGGDTLTAHMTLGRRGNNPFCWHRVQQLRRQGKRERLVPREQAGSAMPDAGRFVLVEEAWDETEMEGFPGPAYRP